MSEDAGIDIDVDAELAGIQAQVAGLEQDAGNAAAANGKAGSSRAVTFMGRQFRIADKIGLMPLLKFAAHSDLRTTDPRGMAAMYAMIRDCIHPGNPGCGKCGFCAPQRCGKCPNCSMVQDNQTLDGELPCTRNRPDPEGCKDFDPGDWAEFERHAIDTRADADDLFGVISDTMEILSGRPTKPPSPSSAGRRSISGGSTARSSGRRGGGSRR